MRKKKIGEILIDQGLVTKNAIYKALEHQERFGGSLTQYLVAGGFLKEEDLAKCLSIQFGFPYLPLKGYDIPPEIIKLVPSHIAQKHLLIPVDKIGHIMTLVMADPFDEEAIREVEKIADCRAQPFVGIISDIIKAIEKYYDVRVEYEDLKKEKLDAPSFIATDNYVGLERRRSLRLRAPIEIHFPEQDRYKKTVTKDISMHGLLFESNTAFPVGAYLTMEINLPKEISPHPMAAVVQVARVVQLASDKFDIGVKIVGMAKEDIDRVVRYALTLDSGKDNKKPGLG